MSDTHLPKRAKRLPGPLLEEIPRADVVVHAGDWVDTDTLDLLESRSRSLLAVYGNNDGPALRARLPEVARAELGGLRLGVIHETGPAQGREKRCAARFPDLDARVRTQSHPVGHHGSHGTSSAQSGVPDGSPPAAPLHLYDRRDHRRPAHGGGPPPAAAALTVRAASPRWKRPGRCEWMRLFHGPPSSDRR